MSFAQSSLTLLTLFFLKLFLRKEMFLLLSRGLLEFKTNICNYSSESLIYYPNRFMIFFFCRIIYFCIRSGFAVKNKWWEAQIKKFRSRLLTIGFSINYSEVQTDIQTNEQIINLTFSSQFQTKNNFEGCHKNLTIKKENFQNLFLCFFNKMWFRCSSLNWNSWTQFPLLIKLTFEVSVIWNLQLNILWQVWDWFLIPTSNEFVKLQFLKLYLHKMLFW